MLYHWRDDRCLGWMGGLKAYFIVHVWKVLLFLRKFQTGVPLRRGYSTFFWDLCYLLKAVLTHLFFCTKLLCFCKCVSSCYKRILQPGVTAICLNFTIRFEFHRNKIDILKVKRTVNRITDSCYKCVWNTKITIAWMLLKQVTYICGGKTSFFCFFFITLTIIYRFF